MPPPEYPVGSRAVVIPQVFCPLVYRRSGALRRSARVLAAAAVFSSGIVVSTRPNAADDAPAPVVTELPVPGDAPPPPGFPIAPAEAATPADPAWPAAAPPVPTTRHPDFEPPVPASDPNASALAPAPTSTLVVTDRESLLPLAQPLWIELTVDQQQSLAPFAGEWNTWSAAEKRSWVALSDRMTTMEPAKREKMQRRISEWAQLTPAERSLARDNYRLAKERSADTRASEWERYRSMTQEQRSVLRDAGSTSNTAAGHAGAATGLAKEAAQPLPRQPRAAWPDRPGKPPEAAQPLSPQPCGAPESADAAVPLPSLPCEAPTAPAIRTAPMAPTIPPAPEPSSTPPSTN